MIDDMSHKETKMDQTAHPLTEESLKRLMQVLIHTDDEMYSCAETFALLDEFAELLVENEAIATEIMPLVYRHLERCGCCRDEYEGLLKILRGDLPSKE